MGEKKTSSKDKKEPANQTQSNYWVPIIVAIITVILGPIIVPVVLEGLKTPTPTPLIFVSPAFTPEPTQTIKLTQLPTQTSTQFPTPTHEVRVCKPAGTSSTFIVDQFYKPKQYMGDTGDIRKVAGGTPNPIQFVYTTNGEGPHEWEYKYINKELNPKPAQFAGVMFIDSAGPGGTDPNNGFDLRGYKTIKWEARSVQGDVDVEFVIGGVTWNWDEQTKVMVSAPYPDSIRSPISLGKPTLNTNWQEYGVVIQDILPNEDSLSCTVGIFGWVITWGDHGVNLITNSDGTPIPENPRTFEIEIRNIRYEK